MQHAAHGMVDRAAALAGRIAVPQGAIQEFLRVADGDGQGQAGDFSPACPCASSALA